jgi:hypothetical protein
VASSCRQAPSAKKTLKLRIVGEEKADAGDSRESPTAAQTHVTLPA